MAGCYDNEKRVASKSRGTRSQFRLNTQGLSPFKCSRPVFLTEVMASGPSSPSGQFNGGGPFPAIKSGRTVREYDQEIELLRAENFELKLRIYLLEERLNKVGGDSIKNNSFEVDVQLTYEAETLQNELIAKQKLLKDSLSQVEKYESDLEEALKENAQLQQQRNEIDALLKETEGKFEELTKQHGAVQKKYNNATIAIQGFVQELNKFPKELRPIIGHAFEAAKEKNKENVVSSVNSLKNYLCQIMCKPYGEVFDSVASNFSDAVANDKIQCLERELYKQKRHCKSIEKKLDSVSNESRRHLQELKQTLSEKEIELQSHVDSLEQVDYETLSYVQNQLAEKTAAIDFLHKFLISHYEYSNMEMPLKSFNQESNKAADRALLSLTNENQNESIEEMFNENQEILNSDETIENIFLIMEDVIKLNNGLKIEVDEHLVEIDSLTATCSDLDQKIVKLETDLSAAKSKLQSLSNEDKERSDKLSIKLSRADTSTQVDVATVEESVQAISDHYLSNMNQSENNNELKDQELYELKQEKAFLLAKLEQAKHQIQMNYTHVDDGYNSEVAKLYDQIYRTNHVNIELVKQLQNLEIFMENILEHKSLDISSLENISDAPDSFSKLSRCLNHIRLLSSTISENLSMCDGSRVFGMEDDSISLNAELLKNQQDFENRSSPYLTVLQPSYRPVAVSNTKEDEGKTILTNYEANFNPFNVKACKRRTWSNSALFPINSIFNSDGVSILEMSDNDDTMVQHDENNTSVNCGSEHNKQFNKAQSNTSMLSSDLTDRNFLHRRRCWGDDGLTNLNFLNKEKPDLFQPIESNVNICDANTNVGATWYNPCQTSDSDIWSEPDRDVSMQRIGIDVKKSPSHLKSPSHKLKLNRARQSTDVISSERSSVPHSCAKVQSWSRRRRNSGSTPRRLSARKDSRLEKHLSLLKEECPRFALLIHQFESTKDLNIKDAEVFADAFDVFKKLHCTISESTKALVHLKDESKSGTSISCQNCIVNDLKQEIENFMEKIEGSDVIKKAIGTAAQHVIEKLVSEVNNLSRQLESSRDIYAKQDLMNRQCVDGHVAIKESDALEIQSSLLSQMLSRHSITRGSIEGSVLEADAMKIPSDLLQKLSSIHPIMKNSVRKSAVEEVDQSVADAERLVSMNAEELQRRLSGQNTNEIKTLIAELKHENDQLKIRLDKDSISSKNLCEQLEKELRQTKMSLEKMVTKCIELEKNLENTTDVQDHLECLLRKCEAHEAEIAKLQEKLKAEKMQVKQLKRENDDLASENKQLDLINGQLKGKLSEETNRISELQRLIENLESANFKTEEENKIPSISAHDKSIQLEENFIRTSDAKYKNGNSQTLKDLNEQLLHKMEENKLQIESSNSKLETMGIQLQKLREENKDFVSKMNDLELTNAELVDRLESGDMEISNLIKENEDLIAKNKKMEETQLQLERSNSKCRQQENELFGLSEFKTQAREFEQQCKDLENDIIKLQYTLKDQEMENERFKKENHELLNTKSQLTEENKSLISQLNDKIKEFENKTSFVENTIVQLENQNKALMVENKRAQEDLVSANSSIDLLTRDLEHTQETLKGLQEKCSNYETKCSNYEKELLDTKNNVLQKIQDLETKCRNYEKELTDTSNVKDNFIQKMRSLKSKLVLSKSKLNDVQKIQLQSKVLSRKDVENKENLMYRKSLTNKDKQIEELYENIILENDGLSDHIELLVKKLSESEIVLQESHAAEEKYRNESITLGNQLQFQEKELSNLKQQLELYERQIRTLEEHSQDITAAQNQVKILEDEVMNLKKQNEQMNLQKEASKERQLQITVSIEKQLKKRENEISDLRKQQNIDLKRSQSLEKQQKFDIESIKRDLKMRDIELSELRKLKESHLAKISQLIEENGKNLSSLQLLQDQNFSLQEKVFNLQLELNNKLEESSLDVRDSKLYEGVEYKDKTLNSIQIKSSRIPTRQSDSQTEVLKNKSVHSLQPKKSSLQKQLERSSLDARGRKLYIGIESEDGRLAVIQVKHSKTSVDQIDMKKEVRSLKTHLEESSLSACDIKLYEGVEALDGRLNLVQISRSKTTIVQDSQNEAQSIQNQLERSSLSSHDGLYEKIKSKEAASLRQTDHQAKEFSKLSDHSVSPIKLIYSKYEGLSPALRGHTMVPVDSTKLSHPPTPTKTFSSGEFKFVDGEPKFSDFSASSLDTSSISIDTDSLYNDPQKLKPHKSEADLNSERLLNEIKTLRERLVIAQDQIELLEIEKMKIRELLASQASDKKSILKAQVDEKLDFQLKLAKKDDFINDLKDQLCLTSNSLVDKQTEVINLEKKISEYERIEKEQQDSYFSRDSTWQPQKFEILNSKLVNEISALKNENFNLKTELMELQKLVKTSQSSHSIHDSQMSEHSFLDSKSSVISADYEKIKELSKVKWSLVETIFTLQKKFYEEKALDLNDHQKFVKYIRNEHSLRVSNSLTKCISEPILKSTSCVSPVPEASQDLNRRNVLGFLEIDIECLRNFKLFLERFALPNALSSASKSVLEDKRLRSELALKSQKIIRLEELIKHLENEQNNKLKQQPSLPSYGSIEKFRGLNLGANSLISNRGEGAALELTCKISVIEDILKSIEPDLNLTELWNETEVHRDDTHSELIKQSMLSKLIQETRSLKRSADKVFQLNSSIRTICGLREDTRLSTSGREFHLSDDALTLSRSASLSPISFEDMCPSKGTPMKRSDDKKYTTPDGKPVESARTHSSKLENIGSSQDSVCPRSQYSSPDLGIESDPNHESSAPEQAEKDTYAAAQKTPVSEKSEMELKLKYNLVETQVRCVTPFTCSEKAKSSKDNVGAMGDTLCAIGALQDYELLKQEIQESLVDIKSVQSRTKDGLLHISKYATPRKSMEHSTFKAIRDTCCSIEVYLNEAVKLIDSFHVAPYPSAEEWNSLTNKNQELNRTLSNLKWEMKKQQNEFHDAMKKLQHAQLVKDSMEKKISKKLLKTKKVLKLAKMQLQEPNLVMCHKCHTSLQTKDNDGSSTSHSNKGGSCT